MVNPVAHFEIYGDDPQKLGEFYQNVFEWKIQEIPGMNYWSVQTVATNEKGTPTESGGINGGLMKRPMPDARSWLNYVTVKSLEETLGIVQRYGGKVVREKSSVPKLGWFALVTDPEMNVFGIWQDDPKAA